MHWYQLTLDSSLFFRIRPKIQLVSRWVYHLDIIISTDSSICNRSSCSNSVGVGDSRPSSSCGIDSSNSSRLVV